MKTTTFGDILNQAAELAQRTRDKLPVVEQTLLQGYLATDFETLFTSQCWPELIPDLYQPAMVNRQFSLNEGSEDPAAPELGDILAVLTANPHTTNRWHHVPFTVGNGVVYLERNFSAVWVEYMLPYPGVVFPELATLTLANFKTALCPRRFRNILARTAAAHLLNADNNTAAAGVQLGLAKTALELEINRLPAIPKWRGFRTASAGRARRWGP